MTPQTGFDPAHLRLTREPSDSASAVHLDVHGYVDYESVEYFMAGAIAHLSAPGLRALHLGCGGLNGLDSMGLSTLLMLRRRTDAAGVTLHLDHRSPALERLLEITGTLDYLVPGHAAEADREPASQRMTYGHTTEDAVQAGMLADPGGLGHRSAEDISGCPPRMTWE
ncbi:STAS domain-containing protein [Streptomyces sp. NPDC059371]|uniref:STAS domain-containing protein n=1 Tax=Streptomyces sp. NPDC059371 TaxID=3346812 RepID=UPI0036BE3D17